MKRALEMGVNFNRIQLGSRSIIEDPKTKNLIVNAVKENGEPIKVKAELVVLATAAVPKGDAEKLSHILNVSRGADGFFMESHPKLDPVATMTEGVFIAGACHGPKDIPDLIAQMKAKASRPCSRPTWRPSRTSIFPTI
jgi:heterodisulfide reductase subunit A